MGLHGSHQDQAFVDTSQLDKAHPFLLRLFVTGLAMFAAALFVSMSEGVVVGDRWIRFLFFPLDFDDFTAMLLLDDFKEFIFVFGD